MDIKFNSLFDNDNKYDETTDEYYSVNRKDDTLILNTILLTFDQMKMIKNVELSNRQFGNSKNYRLGPRPCSTRNASSEKFCDNPGLPEVFDEKVDKCKQYFMPNSSIGDRGQYLRNIDLEARIRKVDYIDSKCDNKTYKSDMCDINDTNCSINCGKKIFKNDTITPPSREYGVDATRNNHKQYCNSLKNTHSQVKNDFLTFQPTKRRDVVKW
jgi:hypothetical protein